MYLEFTLTSNFGREFLEEDLMAWTRKRNTTYKISTVTPRVLKVTFPNEIDYYSYIFTTKFRLWYRFKLCT